MVQFDEQSYADALDKHGAFARINVDDKVDVGKAVMLAVNELVTGATNIPVGSEQTKNIITAKKGDYDSTTKEIKRRQGEQEAGSILITIVGEDHDDNTDRGRGQRLIQAITDNALIVSALGLERDLGYQLSFLPTTLMRFDERSLERPKSQYKGDLVRIKERSMIFAGYLLLCLACGNQAATDRPLILFGQEHFDIPTYLESYAQHTGASYLLRRPRTYLLIPSNAA